jgi:hypothetical protein
MVLQCTLQDVASGMGRLIFFADGGHGQAIAVEAG